MSFLAIPVFGWNVTILQTDSTSFTLQWTSLDANVNHSAKFYIIEVKSNHGILLAMETVPGNSTFTDFKRLRPSTKYHVAVYGVDETGQPYKSLDSHVTTNEGTNMTLCKIIYIIALAIIVDIIIRFYRYNT